MLNLVKQGAEEICYEAHQQRKKDKSRKRINLKKIGADILQDKF